MKDYSMNLEERKDFILGYNVIKGGNIVIKFAKGESWSIPYNERNEQIVLDKMEEQVTKSGELEGKLKKKMSDYFTMFVLFLLGGGLNASLSLTGVDAIVFIISGSVICGISLIPGILSLRTKLKLDDLKKNKRFLEIERELNDNVRSNNNVLANVSSKTKNVVKVFPEDRDIFNINSFNYVPFKDLEQIMENMERNEKFGFVYEETEQVDRPITKTKKI